MIIRECLSSINLEFFLTNQTSFFPVIFFFYFLDTTFSPHLRLLRSIGIFILYLIFFGLLLLRLFLGLGRWPAEEVAHVVGCLACTILSWAPHAGKCVVSFNCIVYVATARVEAWLHVVCRWCPWFIDIAACSFCFVGHSWLVQLWFDHRSSSGTGSIDCSASSLSTWSDTCFVHLCFHIACCIFTCFVDSVSSCFGFLGCLTKTFFSDCSGRTHKFTAFLISYLCTSLNTVPDVV